MQKQKEYDVRFRRGSTHLLVGPSGSGKTQRISSILRLKNEIIEEGEYIENVVFFYRTWQPLYDKLQQDRLVTRWENVMPSNGRFLEVMEPYVATGSICIIDDWETNMNASLETIVKVSSRHVNCTTFLLFQSLFPPHKVARQISLNVKYIHLLKNPRDNAQVTVLARQLEPINYNYIVAAYHKVTREPYGCFLIDLTQECDPKLRFRSHYLPHEFPMRVWVEEGMS